MRLATLIMGILFLSMTACATPPSITKTAIQSNAELLGHAAEEVADGKDECVSTTSTPGWLKRLVGWNQTVESTVKCE